MSCPAEWTKYFSCMSFIHFHLDLSVRSLVVVGLAPNMTTQSFYYNKWDLVKILDVALSKNVTLCKDSVFLI